MDKLIIAALAAVGTIWRIDPATRPVLDVVMWLFCVALALTLGARFNAWLEDLARQPPRRWR